MYKNILVPLDGSERAEAILPHVVALARPNGAKVHLLHVVEPDVILDMSDSIASVRDPASLEARKHRAETYLATQQALLIRQGVEAEAQVVQGIPVAHIATVAGVEEADLIAIVSHGRTGLIRAIYGSVAAEILQQAKCPVLVIRAF